MPNEENDWINDFPTFKILHGLDKRYELLDQQLASGIYSDDTLNHAIKAIGLEAVARQLRLHGIKPIQCGDCQEWTFKAKSAYGRVPVCDVCVKVKYEWCTSCRTYKLKTDNLLHFHVNQLDEHNTYYDYNAKIAEIIPFELRQTDKDRSPRYRNSLLYIGVELEMERRKGVVPPDLIRKALACLGTDFVVPLRDGSLTNAGVGTQNGSNGFELVSLPATKRYHYEAGWLKMFEVLSDYMEPKPPTTGLHFHVSSAALTKGTIAKLVMFINDGHNTEFLTRIADRDFVAVSPTKGIAYAPIFDPYERAKEVVTKKVHRERCPMHPMNRVVRSIYLDNGWAYRDRFGNPIIQSMGEGDRVVPCDCPDGKYDYPDHYAALNLLTKHPTIEFRLFQGSMNPLHFFACMDFCHALIDFCESVAFSHLTHEFFLEWFKAARPYHSRLAKWLVICGYIQDSRSSR